MLSFVQVKTKVSHAYSVLRLNDIPAITGALASPPLFEDGMPFFVNY